MPSSERDVTETLAALERLVRHQVVTAEDARQAARLITGDEEFEFPPAGAGASPAAPAAEPPAGGEPPA